MGVDEIYLGKEQKFLTVVSNLETGAVVVRGGAEETNVGRILRETSECVSTKCDSSGVCGHAVGAGVPDIYDKFHILQHASQAVDEVRRAEFFRKGEQHGIWYGEKRWLLLSSWLNLDRGKRRQLNALFALNRRILKAYLLKESLSHLWDYRCEGAMLRYLQKWIDQLRWQRLKPMKKLAGMLLGHLEGHLELLTDEGTDGCGRSHQWQHQSPAPPRPRLSFLGRKTTTFREWI
jgi:hypothetical protein